MSSSPSDRRSVARAGTSPSPARRGSGPSSSSPSPKRSSSTKSLRASHSSPGLGSRSSAAMAAAAAAHYRLTDQMADASYRLAASRSSEHREQEMQFQWHIFRVAKAQPKVDATPPYSFGMIRDTDKAALHLKVNSPAALRAQEIQMANNALVARIRTQKSTYHDNFNREHNTTSPLVRGHKARALDADLRNGTETARMGGSSGIHFGSTANRKEQKRIQEDNQNLLRALKRINASTGPYNKDKCGAEIERHERLVRHRLPRIMHAHPRSVIESGGKSLRPPIHFSAIATRANSPKRGNRRSISPPRASVATDLAAANDRQEGEDWRNYYEQRGLGSSASQPTLSYAAQVPTIGYEAEEARLRSYSQEGEHSMNDGGAPMSAYGHAASDPSEPIYASPFLATSSSLGPITPRNPSSRPTSAIKLKPVSASPRTMAALPLAAINGSDDAPANALPSARRPLSASFQPSPEMRALDQERPSARSHDLSASPAVSSRSAHRIPPVPLSARTLEDGSSSSPAISARSSGRRSSRAAAATDAVQMSPHTSRPATARQTSRTQVDAERPTAPEETTAASSAEPASEAAPPVQAEVASHDDDAATDGPLEHESEPTKVPDSRPGSTVHTPRDVAEAEPSPNTTAESDELPPQVASVSRPNSRPQSAARTNDTPAQSEEPTESAPADAAASPVSDTEPHTADATGDDLSLEQAVASPIDNRADGDEDEDDAQVVIDDPSPAIADPSADQSEPVASHSDVQPVTTSAPSTDFEPSPAHDTQPSTQNLPPAESTSSDSASAQDDSPAPAQDDSPAPAQASRAATPRQSPPSTARTRGADAAVVPPLADVLANVPSSSSPAVSARSSRRVPPVPLPTTIDSADHASSSAAMPASGRQSARTSAPASSRQPTSDSRPGTARATPREPPASLPSAENGTEAEATQSPVAASQSDVPDAPVESVDVTPVAPPEVEPEAAPQTVESNSAPDTEIQDSSPEIVTAEAAAEVAAEVTHDDALPVPAADPPNATPDPIEETAVAEPAVELPNPAPADEATTGPAPVTNSTDIADSDAHVSTPQTPSQPTESTEPTKSDESAPPAEDDATAAATPADPANQEVDFELDTDLLDDIDAL